MSTSPGIRPSVAFSLSFVAAMLATICTVIGIDELRRLSMGGSTYDSINTAGAVAFVAVIAISYLARLIFAKRSTEVTRGRVVIAIRVIYYAVVIAAVIATVIALRSTYPTSETRTFLIVGDLFHIGTLLWLIRYSREGLSGGSER